MSRLAFLLILIMFSNGCVTPENKRVESRVEPLSRLSFIDSAIFDKKLSKAMKSREGQINTTFKTGFTTNNIPERLDKWFYVIDANGGNVETQALYSRKQGIIGEIIIYIIIKAYQNARKAALYAPAKKYNAMLFYSPEDGIVDRVVFYRDNRNPDIIDVDTGREKRKREPRQRRRRIPVEGPENIPEDKPTTSDGGFLGDKI